jgi:transcriptional regulator with AAA-type ATPase domain
MASGGGSNTTIRVRSTALGAAGDLQWGIRWVFPRWDRAVSWLGEEALVIGRDEACGVFLEGGQLSRRHASVAREGAVARVRDMGSTNGIFVNGARAAESVILPGTVLRLGEWIGVVIEGDPEQEAGYGPIAPGYWGGQTLKAALAPARQAAASELPVILQGETGSGKEGAARALHLWSGRKGAFLAVNCSALPESLAEGQLFGYRKGAFTGADAANAGYFRAADGGTLFLDEFADLPAPVQPKLLRALEQKEVHPLGEARPIQVDVRLVAAAQDSLADLVAAKRIRGDLFARLHGLTVELPPLRSRREDVAPLFAGMVERHAAAAGLPRVPDLETRLVEQLCLYDWPFNVRELDLTARRLIALHGHEPQLRRSNLPESIREHASSGDSGRKNLPTPAAAASAPADPRAFVEALRAHKGNVARAAAALGISRQKAYRLMQSQGTDLAALRDGDDPGKD